MVKKAKGIRTMDIHLLRQVADDGSPFGVEYSTRRLVLESPGDVTCDQPEDALWVELTAGIVGRDPKTDAVLKPGDGAPFMDCVPEYLRYHCMSPCLPVVCDHRGAWRPDNFRITWKPSRHLYWGHGYVITCDRAEDRRADGLGDRVPVAMLEGWGFYHDVGRLEGLKEIGRPPPRVVTVNLLPPRNAVWKETVLGPGVGTRETKQFMRAFLRRFFDRCAIGIFPETEGTSGHFSWRGGF